MIKFCRDGVLRKHFYCKVGKVKHSEWFPIAAFEKALGVNPILDIMGSEFAFEDGLTILQLMQNLEPWADMVGDLAHIDFAALCEEMRQPRVDLANDVLHAELHHTIDAFDMKEGVPSFQNMWHLSGVVHPDHAEKFNGSTHLSFALSPLYDWAHLEIKINETGRLQGALLSNILKPISDRPEDAMTFEVRAPNPIFGDAIVNGFLRGLCYGASPLGRQKLIAKLKAAYDDMNNAKVLTIDETHSLEDLFDSEDFLKADAPQQQSDSGNGKPREDLDFEAIHADQLLAYRMFKSVKAAAKGLAPQNV